VDEPEIKRVELPEPRALTQRERELLDFLVTGPHSCAELREQARTAQVDALCSCGCSSICLVIDRDTPAARFALDRSPFGDPDCVLITAMQSKSRGWTEVSLHVIDGYLYELEIWAGKYGVRPRIDIANLEHVDWRATSAPE
jgi:hypothetical protein